MVERRPRRVTETYQRVREIFIARVRKKASAESGGAEVLHPLVGEHGTFVHAKNEPIQDAGAELPSRGLFIVADGVSSDEGGDVAAALACETIVSHWDTLPNEELSLENTIELMKSSIMDARDAIAEAAQQDPSKATMATTIVVAKLWQGSLGRKKVIFGSVGDSRGAILRRDGKLEQVTIDDDLASNFIADKKRLGALQAKMSNVTSYDQLSDQPMIQLAKPTQLNVYRNGIVQNDAVTELTEQDLFASRNYIRISLSAARLPEVNIEMRNISSGNTVVLSTDGETDNNRHNERQRILSTPASAQQKAQSLGEAAVLKSQEEKSPDNIRPKFDDTLVKVITVA